MCAKALRYVCYVQGTTVTSVTEFSRPGEEEEEDVWGIQVGSLDAILRILAFPVDQMGSQWRILNRRGPVVEINSLYSIYHVPGTAETSQVGVSLLSHRNYILSEVLPYSPFYKKGNGGLEKGGRLTSIRSSLYQSTWLQSPHRHHGHQHWSVYTAGT